MINYPNLMHLKFFCDAVRYESISEAAKMNHVSSSAISQAITKLESIFGTELIYRNKNPLKITYEGQIVYDQTKFLYKKINETFELIDPDQQKRLVTLNFLTSISIGLSFIAPMYKKMKDNQLNIKLNFKMEGLNLIRRALKQGDIEFAVVLYEEEFADYEKITLKKGCFNLYQAKKAKKNLIKDGVFVYEKEGIYVKELQSFLEKQGYQNPIKDNIVSWELVARFTDLNVGVGFLPDYILFDDRYVNIEKHPLEIPQFEYEICAIYNKNHKLSKSALFFLNQFSQI